MSDIETPIESHVEIPEEVPEVDPIQKGTGRSRPFQAPAGQQVFQAWLGTTPRLKPELFLGRSEPSLVKGFR